MAAMVARVETLFYFVTVTKATFSIIAGSPTAVPAMARRVWDVSVQALTAKT